jgi:predicted lipoprotein with Yx(FWY)xxD motif
MVFADAKGMPLYASDKKVDASACKENCAQLWVPFAASADAKATGDWSIVKAKGIKQWALRGKPLYTYSKDAAPAAGGMGYGMAAANGQAADSAFKVQPVVAPRALRLPREVSISEVLGAPGVALVNSSGMSLYAFGKKASKANDPVSTVWQPLIAPASALPVGDFTIVSREHGDTQWAFKGKPLYTFEQDRELNDANGRGVDPRMQVAVIARYFTPAEVAMRKNERRGGLLVNAADGKTLYGRDRISHNHTGGHNARGSTRGVPTVGAAIGLAGCDAQCEREWKPLAAPADAQPSGYWSVFVRPDGSKQWAYQGYALYTNENDKPGLAMEHDSYVVVVNDDTRNLAPESFGLGLYWRAVSP